MAIRNALSPVLGLLLALAAAPASATLQDGQVINLKALGGGGSTVWLQGDPNTGAVRLATDAATSSGTAWQVVVAPGGTTIGLKNLASGTKPWLGGDTGQGSVQLTDDTSGNAGTSWQVQDNGDGTISLACVGGQGVYPWLDGETAPGSVMLRENNITYPGTRWQVQNSSSAPGCFNLSSPADGSTVTIPATLTWQASTGATSYGVTIYDTSCENGTPIHSISSLTATTYSVPSGVLKGGSTYAWLVTAVNGGGTTTYSNNCKTSATGACWTFTAATPAPACFDLSSPASGARVTTTPTLQWKSSANATGYDVRIYDTTCGNGDAIHAVSGLTSTSYTVPEGALESGRVYSWLVRAVNGTGFTHSNSCSTSYSGACWTFGVQTSTMKEFAVPTPGSGPGFLAAGPDGNLWFTEYQGNKVGRITPAGLVTEFPVPTANSWPSGIVSGPDGNLWFTEAGGNNIGRITPSGAVTEFPIPTDASLSYAIAAGSDGNLWFAEFNGNRIGKITPAGVVTEFPVPTARSWPYGIAAGPDGNVWFTEANANAVGMITPEGVVTEFPLPNANSRPRGVAGGPDGNVWFTEYGGNRIGTITPSGVVTEFALPSASSWPFAIALGSDRNLWFTEYGGNRIGTVTASGVVTEFAVPTAGSSPAGIASGADGNVWFTEQDGNKIGEFLLAPAVRSVTVPIVLSIAGLNGSLFTSELSLTNRGTSDAPLTFTYVPAFGGAAGGSATDTLPAGTQRIVPDAIEYLRSLGIATGAAGSSGGTLRIDAAGSAAATVRTTTAVPGGRAGLAYRGLSRAQLLSDPVWIPGLRQNATDRSNVAVVNAGSASEGSITLRLTVVSGDPAHPQSLALPDVTLAPGAFSQVSGVLASNGLSLTNGYVRVERVSGTAPFYAYGVVNDQANSDGSFIEPVPAGAASPISRLTLPVLVETSAYSSELVLTNVGSAARTLHATWAASALTGGQVTFDLALLPNEQQILPAFVQVLRDRGVVKDAPGPGFAGALFVTDASGDLRGVSVAARTSTPGGGGRYGVFYGAVPGGSEASSSAWLYDLRQDAENRTNLALVNLGSTDSSADTFRIDLYDGANGQKAASVDAVSVPARGFLQVDEILKRNAPAVSSGYALVTRTAGNNPFIAYAVINDGAQPGARSGDGAFVTADIPAAP